jgi:PPOX class probable F420-dependent enzyme
MLTLTAEQYAFLETMRIGHLGTANAMGEPHVVPVCYTVLDDAAYILIDCKKKRFDEPDKLQRVINIQTNPCVCLTVDRYDEDWSQLGFVMIHGAASLLKEGQDYDTALSALVQRYPQYREQQLDGRPMISIQIQKVWGWGLVSG